jgi:hypothetical protein
MIMLSGEVFLTKKNSFIQIKKCMDHYKFKMAKKKRVNLQTILQQQD